MINFLKKRFALSKKGAYDFIKGVIFTTLLNIALMFPAIFTFLFLDDYLRPIIEQTNSEVNSFMYYFILSCVLMIITWLIAIFQYSSTHASVYSESANRRVSIAEKLRKLPLSFFGEKNLSDLTGTIMADNAELEKIFSHTVPQLFAAIIFLCLATTGLFITNWKLALALLWVVPIATLVVILSKKLQIEKNKIIYNDKREVSSYIQEGLENIAEIKSYNNEEKYTNNLEEKLDKYEKNLTKGELTIGVLLNSSQSILKLGLVSVIFVGVYLLSKNEVSLFTYLIFLILATRIYSPISDVLNNLAALFHLDIPIKRMNEIKNLKTQSGSKDFKPKNYDIVFKNVNFSYETGKQVIKNVSFIAKQGEITALIGSSGGGKSTATKLAARFWDIDSGKITLGGQDISKIDPETLLKNYSFVFQDVTLFNTSIKDNIRIGKHNATDEEIIKAAKMAQCDDFIRKTPNGYDTIIAENGDTLSGGEKQRISIARALLKDAPIILLDESTASLDVENETKIQQSISELIKNKTVLIIAHRMRTIAHADKIVVLENGKVIETGNPNDLSKNKNSAFTKMCKIQIKDV
ncbi:MAG: ABC transporter ATP-binding protein/permease [Candidatus Gracilibacteria bacterium]|nr:ABC transporter ATP-binding protein/permease [Candidatus Gracilibacteria bacterium]